MPNVYLSIDEVVATLIRSSCPTLVAEGVDDIIMLRRLENVFGEVGLSVLPLGGRKAVLELFERRSEIPSEKIVLFLADKDVWVYTGIPTEYISDDIMFTDGYSIENDLYEDGKFERLLTAEERSIFDIELERFLNWYVISLSRHFRDPEIPISVHPSAVLDDDSRYHRDTMLDEYELFPDESYADIRIAYARLLRGKSLMALLVRQLSSSKRLVKHSLRSLIEHASVSDGGNVRRIASWLSRRLENIH